jgi:hypothetical protein
LAKKSMVAKQKRTKKFAVQEYTRCERADVRIVFFASSNFAVSASGILHTKVKFRALKKLAGNSV